MRRFLGAAAIGCGIFFSAWAANDVLPDSGALRATTMQRLTLLDAERVGARIVAVGDRGYIVLSDDRGATWRRAKAPAEPMLTAVSFLDAQRGLAVGHDSVILLTRDGGETWTQQFSAPGEQRPLLDVIFAKKDLAIAVGAASIVLSWVVGSVPSAVTITPISLAKFGFHLWMPFRRTNSLARNGS